MATTLKIRNETGSQLQIETGGIPVILDDGEEADLSEQQLKSLGFSKAAEAGQVSFVVVGTPSAEQIALARLILPNLVKSLGSQVSTLKGRFEKTQKDLLNLSVGYNKTWKTAETDLMLAQASAPGWPNVKDAVQALLFDTAAADPDVVAKQAEVDAIVAAIDALNNEDLTVTGRTLEQWFVDRLEQEQLLTTAQSELAELETTTADPLVAEVNAVDANVTAVTALVKAYEIGVEIAPFG
jgi:hypothetical protein